MSYMQQSHQKGIGGIIFSSSLGTLIEWYDFYIFGFLAKIFATHFFPDEMGASAKFISTLSIFAAGFLVRPFGALVFGRIGDLLGRKYTFLLTLVLMGASTFAIGLVPGYKTLGYAAPVIVLILRLIQGLALGGEYGGAATYVAEHSPENKRGFYTSWIQTTATLGLFVALGVILIVRSLFTDTAAYEAEWGGWRYPFWASLLLVGVSIYIRLKMHESPLFAKLKSSGNISKNPLKESFAKKENFKMVLLALFGAVMGQGVVWYTGQFYAQTFLENKVLLNFDQSRTVILWAVALGTPFFILFGWLSDKIGRKWIMITGMLLGAIFYRPIFTTFLNVTNTANAINTVKQESTSASIKNKYFKETETTITSLIAFKEYHNDNTEVSKITIEIKDKFTNEVKSSKTELLGVQLGNSNYIKFVILIFVMVVFVTMAYGPVAAFLVELFPTKIRYTSMSLPYHIGNGIFGGLVPVVATLITDTVKDTSALDGLYYPIGIAALCAIIGAFYLPNKIDSNVMDNENELI
jgi:MFS family permease